MKQKIMLPASVILTIITFIALAITWKKGIDDLEKLDFNEEALYDDDLF
jgi:hypothetical protein